MKTTLTLLSLAWSVAALGGEILLSPPKSESPSVAGSGKDASRQREAARDYRMDQGTDAPVIIVAPDEDDGMLAPRRSGSPSAADISARARANRQKSESGSSVPQTLSPDQPAHGSVTENSTQRARENRNRALDFRTGGQKNDRSVATVGKDGLPIIDCSSATENSAGRIGDDTRSGSVVILVQDRNQIKVRCK